MRSTGSALGVVLCAIAIGCGGSNFDIPEEPQDTGTTSDGAGDTVTGDGSGDTSPGDGGGDTSPGDGGGDTITPPVDTGPEVWPDAGCTAPGSDTPDLYVDASVASSGKGSAGCPFKTIREATTAALYPTVIRTIHVRSGSYAETDVLKLTGNMRLVGEFGVVKLGGGSAAACTPSAEKCNISMDPGALVDNFDIDAKQNGNGIVGGGTSVSGGKPLVIKNTSVKNAQKDGINLFMGGELGPNIHADENGYSGVATRGGLLHVAPGTNSFDRNKGTAFVTGSYAPRGGIVLYGYATINFEGGSASENAMHGIIFDGGSVSTVEQKFTGLIAQKNGEGGLTVNHSQSAVTLRKSTLTKNTQYGMWLSYNSGATNKFDFGTVTSGGGNVFGGASGGTNNGKVGVFLCGSGLTASQAGEGNSWAKCPPTQSPTVKGNCDSWPAAYADVGYVPSGSTPSGPNPLAPPTSCTLGP